MDGGSLPPGTFRDWKNRRGHGASREDKAREEDRCRGNGITVLRKKMPDVDLVNRHPALQSMCSKD
jgi:hypothetical protein